MRTKRMPAQELRAAIDRLPLEVREAVLEGLGSRRRIIAGAAADGAGGVCPMVAATLSWTEVDRASVERAKQAAWLWDRYAEATRAGRVASRRQLLALKAMLEGSILAERAGEAGRAGDADRSVPRRRVPRPLRGPDGWSWSVLFRTYDDYEQALREFGELPEAPVIDELPRERERVHAAR